MVYELEKEHKKTSLMCKKKEELVKEIMRLEHNVNVMNERLSVQANAIKHYEQESRNKAIDEFTEKICTELTERSFEAVIGADLDNVISVVSHDKMQEVVMEIAEQLKGGAK